MPAGRPAKLNPCPYCERLFKKGEIRDHLDKCTLKPIPAKVEAK